LITGIRINVIGFDPKSRAELLRVRKRQFVELYAGYQIMKLWNVDVMVAHDAQTGQELMTIYLRFRIYINGRLSLTPGPLYANIQVEIEQ